jgi:hypothetical protein
VGRRNAHRTDVGAPGAFVSLRHDTSRHRRGVCLAADTRASKVWKSDGNSRRVRGLPLPTRGGGESSRGAPRMALIRFRGHLSKGEYDVQTDGRHTEAARPPPVHG